MTAKEESALSTGAGSGSRMDDSSAAGSTSGSVRVDKDAVKSTGVLSATGVLSMTGVLSAGSASGSWREHRLGEVYRRTLSDRHALRQQHGLTGNTVPIDGSTSLGNTSLNNIMVITQLGDSRSTSTMLPMKTTITLQALLTCTYWILTSNTLCRHVTKQRRKI